jgi:hypothetical protein
LIVAGLKALKKTGDMVSHFGSELSSGLSCFGSLFGGDDGQPMTAPDNLNASYTTNPAGLLVTWDADYGWSYEVQLTDSTGQVLLTTEADATFDFQPPVATLSIPIDSLPTKPGVYTIMVRMGFLVVNGPWGQLTIVKLATAANVVMRCDATGESVTVLWAAVASATQYAVVVRDTSKNTAVVSATFSSPAGARSQLNQTFSADQLGNQSASSYIASVQALAGDTAIPGDAVDAAALPKLAAPATVTQTVVSEGLRVTWTPVLNQTAYRVIVYRQNTLLEVVNMQVVLQITGSAGLIERDFSFDQFSAKLPGEYLATVMVLGDAMNIASDYTISLNSNVLFSGIGNMQIGTTFTIS